MILILVDKIKMNAKFSKYFSSSSTPSTSTSTEHSIINLIPCEYEPVDGYDSPSEDSIDSSELIDSSDDELEVVKINEIYNINVQSN